MPAIDWIATGAATVLSFLLGAVWYGPLFGKAWLEENNITTEKLEQLKKEFNPGKTYGLTLVLSFLSAAVFGMFIGPHPGLSFAVSAGVAAGFFWIATSFASTYLWEGKTLRHWLINGGYHTVRFGLIGLAFGLLG